MDNETQDLTLIDVLTRRFLEVDAGLATSNISSEEHKLYLGEYKDLAKLILEAKNQEDLNDIKYRQQDLEEKKQEDSITLEHEKILNSTTEKEKKGLFPEYYDEIAKMTLTFVKDILIIVLPLVAAAEKQRNAQKFVDIQMRREWEYEQHDMIRANPGKTSWRMVENQTKDI